MLNGVEAWLPPSGGTVELVAAGRAWDAVRVPSRIGLAVIERLGDDSGAVIQDASGGILYWLVRPGAADDWELPQLFVEICGDASYVAVPPVGRIEDHHRLRWIVPLTRTCYLTDPELLHAVLVAEIDALFGPRPVLLPCEPCLGSTMFGGRCDCKGTSSIAVTGRQTTPVQPESCPCEHSDAKTSP